MLCILPISISSKICDVEGLEYADLIRGPRYGVVGCGDYDTIG